MDKFVFFRFGYGDVKDGLLARLETEVHEVPFNVIVEDGSDLDLQEEDVCCAELYGTAGDDMKVWPTEEALYANGCDMAVPSMIPVGTFPRTWGEPFYQNPWILFVGNVLEVEAAPEAPSERSIYCLLVETLEMTLHLSFRYDGLIKPGDILYGTAWLRGRITRV